VTPQSLDALRYGKDRGVPSAADQVHPGVGPAGTAQDDTYGLTYARSDIGNGMADAQAFESMLDTPSDPIPGIVDCPAPINAGSHTPTNCGRRWTPG
jgi:hypothetical protein